MIQLHFDAPILEHWSGLPCPPPGDLPNPGIEPRCLPNCTDSLPSEPPEKQIKFVFPHNHSSWVNKTCLCADTITFWCTYSRIFTLTPFSDSISGCRVLNLFVNILASCHHPSLILHFTCILLSLRI